MCPPWSLRTKYANAAATPKSTYHHATWTRAPEREIGWSGVTGLLLPTKLTLAALLPVVDRYLYVSRLVSRTRATKIAGTKRMESMRAGLRSRVNEACTSSAKNVIATIH